MATHTIHPMTNTWTNGRTDCVHNSMHPSKQDVQILWMCEKVWHLLRFRQLIGNLKKMASHTHWRRAHLLTVYSCRYIYLPSSRIPAGILWWTLFTLFEPSNRLGMNVLHWKFWFNEPDTDAFFFCTCHFVQAWKHVHWRLFARWAQEAVIYHWSCSKRYVSVFPFSPVTSDDLMYSLCSYGIFHVEHTSPWRTDMHCSAPSPICPSLRVTSPNTSLVYSPLMASFNRRIRVIRYLAGSSHMVRVLACLQQV